MGSADLENNKINFLCLFRQTKQDDRRAALVHVLLMSQVVVSCDSQLLSLGQTKLRLERKGRTVTTLMTRQHLLCSFIFPKMFLIEEGLP